MQPDEMETTNKILKKRTENAKNKMKRTMYVAIFPIFINLKSLIRKQNKLTTM